MTQHPSNIGKNQATVTHSVDVNVRLRRIGFERGAEDRWRKVELMRRDARIEDIIFELQLQVVESRAIYVIFLHKPLHIRPDAEQYVLVL